MFKVFQYISLNLFVPSFPVCQVLLLVDFLNYWLWYILTIVSIFWTRTIHLKSYHQLKRQKRKDKNTKSDVKTWLKNILSMRKFTRFEGQVVVESKLHSGLANLINSYYSQLSNSIRSYMSFIIFEGSGNTKKQKKQILKIFNRITIAKDINTLY